MSLNQAELENIEPLVGRMESIAPTPDRSSFLKKLQRSLHEDGYYVLATRRLTKASAMFRNYMLAR